MDAERFREAASLMALRGRLSGVRWDVAPNRVTHAASGWTLATWHGRGSNLEVWVQSASDGGGADVSVSFCSLGHVDVPEPLASVCRAAAWAAAG